MNMTAQRLRSMGWIATLVVCAALVLVLAFWVNGLRSKVQKSSAEIVALKQETLYLETEFETRANQQQLKALNDVEFGYIAPTAAQYLDNERQLAAYARPIEPGAPAPVRVASADDDVAAAAALPTVAAPPPVVTHKGAKPAAVEPASGLAGLGDRLATVHHARTATAPHQAALARSAKPKPLTVAKAKLADAPRIRLALRDAKAVK